MKLSRLLFALVLVFSLQGLSAQDIHYTLFDMAPLRINPALTGAFSGTARVGGIYRGQWFAVPGASNVETPSFYGDAPVIKGFRDKDWVGAGFSFISDQTGPFHLNTTIVGLSASYHFALDKKGASILTLGAQYNQVQRRVNFAIGGIHPEEFISEPLGGGGLNTSVDFSTDRDTEKSYKDINIGLLYKSKLDKSSSLELGLAALHVNSPQARLLDRDTISAGDRAMTLSSHAKYEWALDEKWSMAPAVYFQTTKGGKNEILVQAWAGRQMNEELKLNFGLGWRVGDAASLMFGGEYKDVRAALSYDLNLRKTASSITNTFGGFELAAYYIIKIYKKPELPQKVLCPEF